MLLLSLSYLLVVDHREVLEMEVVAVIEMESSLSRCDLSASPSDAVSTVHCSCFDE